MTKTLLDELLLRLLGNTKSRRDGKHVLIMRDDSFTMTLGVAKDKEVLLAYEGEYRDTGETMQKVFSLPMNEIPFILNALSVNMEYQCNFDYERDFNDLKEHKALIDSILQDKPLEEHYRLTESRKLTDSHVYRIQDTMNGQRHELTIQSPRFYPTGCEYLGATAAVLWPNLAVIDSGFRPEVVRLIPFYHEGELKHHDSHVPEPASLEIYNEFVTTFQNIGNDFIETTVFEFDLQHKLPEKEGAELKKHKI